MSETIYKLENIHVVTLTDQRASKQDVLKTIDKLARNVKHGYSFIFFNASHDLLLQNQYYIITTNFNGDVGNTNSIISSYEIEEPSKKIKSLSQ